MKNFNLIILSTILLCGCINKKNTPIENKKSTTIKQGKYIFKIYYANIDNQYSSIDSMTMIINNHNLQQHLNLTSKKIHYKTNLIPYIQFYNNEDFNFDGYNDLYFLPSSLPDFNYRSFHFLYNNKTKQFVESEILDSLYNIELVAETKEICTRYNNKNLGYSEFSKYKWNKNTLINVEKVEEIESNGEILLSISRNNKIMIKDSIITKSIIVDMQCQ